MFLEVSKIVNFSNNSITFCSSSSEKSKDKTSKNVNWEIADKDIFFCKNSVAIGSLFRW